jgi:sugar phosphate isomerase/epimerase
MATPELDHVRALELAKRYGFDGIDLRVSDDRGEVKPGSSEEELLKIKNDFETAGIKIPALLCYKIDLSEGGEKMIQNLERHLDIAGILGAPWIRIFTGDPAKTAKPEYFTREYSGVIKKVLSKRQDKPGILIQNHRGNAAVREILEILELIKDSRCNLVYSPDHLEGMDFDKTTEECMPYIREIYIADRNAEGRPVLPGSGIIPLAGIIKKLDSAGYRGFYTFKWERIWHQLPGVETAFPVFFHFLQSPEGW